MAVTQKVTFSPGTRFALYDGLPLSLSGDTCIAWDRFGGRPFDRGLFDTYAEPCSESTFRQADVEWEKLDYTTDFATHDTVALPKKFPEGTEFADQENIPLTALGDECTAWDRPGGRWFNHATFKHRSYRCDEKEFRELVDKVNRDVARARKQKRT